MAMCRPDELRVRDVHPQGGIRDAVRPASAASGCRMPARPGPQAGGRPTQPDQDQEDEDQGEEQQEKKAGGQCARKKEAPGGPGRGSHRVFVRGFTVTGNSQSGSLPSCRLL